MKKITKKRILNYKLLMVLSIFITTVIIPVQNENEFLAVVSEENYPIVDGVKISPSAVGAITYDDVNDVLTFNSATINAAQPSAVVILTSDTTIELIGTNVITNSQGGVFNTTNPVIVKGTGSLNATAGTTFGSHVFNKGVELRGGTVTATVQAMNGNAVFGTLIVYKDEFNAILSPTGVATTTISGSVSIYGGNLNIDANSKNGVGIFGALDVFCGKTTINSSFASVQGTMAFKAINDADVSIYLLDDKGEYVKDSTSATSFAGGIKPKDFKVETANCFYAVPGEKHLDVSLSITVPEVSTTTTVSRNEEVVLSATGDSSGIDVENLTYEWYTVDELGNLTVIPGANGATYSAPTDLLGTTKFVVRYVDTSDAAFAQSSEVTVNVIAPTVTFDANGGLFLDDKETVTQIPNDKDLLPAEVEIPSNVGSIFMGWKIGDEILTTQQVEEREYLENTTVVAQWALDANNDGVADEFQKNVTFEVVGGTWNDGSNTPKEDTVDFMDGDTPSKTGTGNLESIPEGLVNVGYSGEWDIIPPTNDVTIDQLEDTYTFIITPNEYIVNFDKNDINASGSTEKQEFVYDVTENLNTNGFENPGNIFLGWSTDPNAITPEFNDNESITNLLSENNAEETLYAVWGPDENNDGILDIYQTKVIYKVINGSWQDGFVETEIEEWITFELDGVPSNDKDAIGMIKNTPTSAHANVGFDQNTGRWFNDVPTSIKYTDQVYTYTYTFSPMLNVSYPAVSPDDSKLPINSFEIENNGKVTVDNDNGELPKELIITTDTQLEEPLKEGHEFTGYKYNPDTNTLVATWKKTDIYIVEFEENGGSEVENQNVKFDDKVITPTIPTKEGYTFVGWYLDVEITSEFDFENMKMPNHNITLYAKYEKIDNNIETSPATSDKTNINLLISIMILATMGITIASKREEM